MLKINLASFEDYGEFSFVLKNKETSFEGVAFEDGFEVNATLTRDSDNSVVVTGTMRGSIKSTCSRCLEEFDHEVDTDFVAVYKNKPDMTKDDEDNDVYPYEKNVLDLYEYVKDSLLLELPLKPVCRQDCAGLCPVCGKNQNREKCSCEKPAIGSPLQDIEIEIKKKDK